VAGVHVAGVHVAGVHVAGVHVDVCAAYRAFNTTHWHKCNCIELSRSNAIG
jgi:hypothetical protein